MGKFDDFFKFLFENLLKIFNFISKKISLHLQQKILFLKFLKTLKFANKKFQSFSPLGVTHPSPLNF